jgi:hypothetical protein
VFLGHDELEDFMRWASLILGELKCSVNRLDVAEGNVRVCVEIELSASGRVSEGGPGGSSEEG